MTIRYMKKPFGVTSNQRNAEQNHKELSPHPCSTGNGVKMNERQKLLAKVWTNLKLAHFGWQYKVVRLCVGFSRKLEIELPCDSVITLVCTHSKELKSGSQRDTYISMFIAALFAITKTQRQDKCPLMINEFKNVFHPYT